ncbi:TPA: site-specific DNA-methyltransferase [Escherichia coli]|uniref:site-specific DNA-methyltransferase (adenine-specific) n=1 Tax=Escherichia coli TaxID=562 RepID=A0A9Q5TJC3_ECOLX|nr:site-specific DNA-methyltransferase [Escherichia coli]ELY4831276.1 site-specific DNA-methyltransferase [Cronobacter sakazakii]MCK1078783.1 site-specific DNA-methyltransferase [Enterobacter cloacae subsp. cloacae]MCZ3440603.1 site-specific DNA-methyltransferase [Klebsiella pneumoniae]HAS1737628.1 site-specific DNA-methyltransferase [Enterobacter cloacae]HAU6769530.1 site-specific DNA-methyltransferase [Salmonella enterica subsp. enterica serovar Kouka]HDR2749365.1 site-specific DNA-methyltr
MKNVIPEMDSQSMDIVADNISKLKELFPEAFIEGKVDFDALKEVLGDYVDGREERYSFTWNGKSKARMLAQTPSAGTLRPCKEESVDWDNTQNLFIEGDNLEVLKLLQKSYHKKVKMIYIDPPYNTGKDFVYKDNFKDNIKNYKEITGQVDGEGRNLSNNPETSGRYHTDWLNMMYPRLKLARNLLKDDGVIFISIDDNEFANIRKIADEIFGEENFIASIVWQGGRKNDSRRFSVVHDYILVYVKNENYLSAREVKWRERKEGLDQVYEKHKALLKKHGSNYDEASKELKEWFNDLGENDPSKEHSHYSKMDEGGVYYGDNISSPNYRENLIFEYKGYKPPKNGWRYNQEAMARLDREGLLIFPSSKESRIQYKRYLHHTETWAPSTFLYKDRRAASKSLSALMGGEFFDFPKDISVLARLIDTFTGESDLVLDFFAGSSAFAHACIELNVRRSKANRFVMVQLPEITDEKSEAFKAGYKTISDISKERIRRAACQIKDENPDYQGDLGFKVFKLDSTNIKPWELDFDLTEQDLEDQISNIKHGRKEEDVLYEVLLKYGLDLTLPIAEHSVAGHKVFDIGMGALVICLSDDITLDVVEGIVKLKDELNPEIIRVVFKDAGFADDVVKTNAVQILKQAGIEDVRSL